MNTQTVLEWRDRSIWRAADLGDLEARALTLDACEIQELEDASRFQRADTLASIDAASFPLTRLAVKLAAVRDELLEGVGFAIIRGLPIERHSPLQRAAIFLGVGAHLGRARVQNGKGHLLGHVRDEGLSSADPNVRIYQTRERQTFHTDSCDVVGLLSVREALRGGDSLLVSAGAIAQHIGREHPDLLARLLAPVAHDRRGEVPSGAKPWFELPVLSWHGGTLTVFYQRQYIDSAQRFAAAPRLDALTVRALDLFDALADDPRFHVRTRLHAGDMLFVHNHSLLHDRTAFEDAPDAAQKRHLLRLWLAIPGARELPPAFAARYGSITVGDRGGVAVPGAEPCVPVL